MSRVERDDPPGVRAGKWAARWETSERVYRRLPNFGRAAEPCRARALLWRREVQILEWAREWRDEAKRLEAGDPGGNDEWDQATALAYRCVAATLDGGHPNDD